MQSHRHTISRHVSDAASTSAPTSKQVRFAGEAASIDDAQSMDGALTDGTQSADETEAIGQAPAVDRTSPQLRTDADALPAIASVSPAEAMALSLSPPQRTAIQMLTSGRTAIDSALAAGVSRRTLYRWLKTDANFQAAYNAWQHDAIATARGKVLALTDAAIDAVRRALTKGDAKTALVILKSTGMLDRPDPGSSDPEEVKVRQAVARERAETNLFLDKLTSGLTE